jgi:hypothetical protein
MDPDSALENNLNLPSKNDKAEKIRFLAGILKTNDENSGIRIHSSEAWIRTKM